MRRGFTNLRCLVRPSSNLKSLEQLADSFPMASVKIARGNLLSRPDCAAATEGVAVIYHLAAGTGLDSYPDAYMNSVVTTRNLLEAARAGNTLKRFVNVSSFTVYANTERRGVLDETSAVEPKPELRGDPYCYAKVKQDELLAEYGKKHGIPFVIVRPGVVYGPGKKGITARVGIGMFGLFLHLGGSNRVPLTYIENCSEAIVLAGLKPGVDGEVFNIVDDDLPSSRQILRMYKRQVRSFKSVYVPRPISYLCFRAWEKYSGWSKGQLPPVFNRSIWNAYWRGSAYTNAKIKQRLGWRQLVPTAEGLKRYVETCRESTNGS